MLSPKLPRGGDRVLVIPSCWSSPVKSPDLFSIHPAEQLQQKDLQILLLLEEKEMIFRDMTECSTPLPEECSPTHSSRILFRSNTEEALRGGPLMRRAINEGNLCSARPPPHPSECGLRTNITCPFLLFYHKQKHKPRKQPETVIMLLEVIIAWAPCSHYPGQGIKCRQTP